MTAERRRPFTCLECWETRAENVDLLLTRESFNNRSVESHFDYRCPQCGWETRLTV